MTAHNQPGLSPQAAKTALDVYFLEVRSKLLDVAAALDRIGRGADSSIVATDTRLEKIHEALRILQESPKGRTERVQRVFSLEYDPAWIRPHPR
jgi:hypothetical protein